MAWSTRELAELTGTTVNTIRHYHRLGLLDEPERRYNGYKQYGVRHLVRLLRIRRLVELGVPLGRIGAMGESSGDTTATLVELDAELEANILRLQKARGDIAAILTGGAPADGPPGFEHLAARLTEMDSSMLHLSGQMLDNESLKDLRRMVEEDTDSLSAELEQLPEDADEETKQSLADRMVPGMVRDFQAYPWLLDPIPRMSVRNRGDIQVFSEAVLAMYNSAQLDVLLRMVQAAAEQVRAQPGDGEEPG